MFILTFGREIDAARYWATLPEILLQCNMIFAPQRKNLTVSRADCRAAWTKCERKR
jgi:hypothetical protein